MPGLREITFFDEHALRDDMDVRVPRVVMGTTFQLQEGDTAVLSVTPQAPSTKPSEAPHESRNLIAQGSVVDPQRQGDEANLSTLRQLSDTGSHTSTSLPRTG